MGNIHLGKEITVITIRNADDPYSGMKAIADDLRTNLGDLSDTVCEIDGTLRSGLLNDIGIATAGVTQFGVTLLHADEGFKKFLAEMEEFKLHPVIVQTPATQFFLNTINGENDEKTAAGKLDTILEIIEHITGISSNILDIFDTYKELSKKGTGKLIKDADDIRKDAFKKNGINEESDNGLEEDASTIDGTATETGAETIAAEGGETLEASLLTDIETGAFFGPEGILAGLIIGTLATVFMEFLAGREGSNKPEVNNDINPAQLVYKDGSPVFSSHKNSVAPANSGGITTTAGNEMTGGFAGDGGPSEEVNNHNSWQSNSKTNEEAHHGIITAIPGAVSSGYGGYSNSGGQIMGDNDHYTLYNIFINPDSGSTNDNDKYINTGGSTRGYKAASPHSSGTSATNAGAENLPSASHLSSSSSDVSHENRVSGGNVSINIHTNDTFNTHSDIKANDIHDMVVEVLTSAVADSRIGVDVH